MFWCGLCDVSPGNQENLKCIQTLHQNFLYFAAYCSIDVVAALVYLLYIFSYISTQALCQLHFSYARVTRLPHCTVSIEEQHYHLRTAL